MLSEKQILQINRRRLATIKLFLSDMTLSDEKLAELLNNQKIITSSSTVGRDLTNIEIIELISKISPEKNANMIYEQIQQARKRNKENGQKLGGHNYSLNNTATKDYDGKFTVSYKR